MMRKASGIAVVGSLAFAGLCAVLAQAPARQDAPVIRTAARLVTVSVIVRDKDGKPVTGLTQDDFALLDEGKPQTVSLFSVDVTRTPGAAPRPLAPLPANTFTNRYERRGQSPPNATVVLLDSLNTPARDQIYGKQQVLRFLEQLRAEDRVALYLLTGRGLRVLHDFTQDSTSLIRALQRMRAVEERHSVAVDTQQSRTGSLELEDLFRELAQRDQQFYLRDRVYRTVDALVAIAAHLAQIPGRKNLIWVSGSFPISFGFEKLTGAERMPGSEAAQLPGASPPGSTDPGTGNAGGSQSPQPGKGGVRASALQRVMPPGDPDLLISPEQGIFFEELERAARALNQAGLAIYPVDARGLLTQLPNPNFDPAKFNRGVGPTQPEFTTGGPDRKAFDVMNLLADRTGGRAFYNMNEIHSAIREAVDESRVTYELAYYPTHDKWDSSFHEIKVRVKRPGLEVRHRRGYYAVADSPQDAAGQAQLLEGAAHSPLEATTLSLTARLEPVAGQPAALNLRIEMNAREMALEGKDGRWTGALALLFVQKGEDGTTLATTSQRLDLRLEPATHERLLREGMRLNKRIELQPGAVELRIAVRDAASGATGSVHIPLGQWAAEAPK